MAKGAELFAEPLDRADGIKLRLQYTLRIDLFLASRRVASVAARQWHKSAQSILIRRIYFRELNVTCWTDGARSMPDEPYVRK